MVRALATFFVIVVLAGCYATTPPRVNYRYNGFGTTAQWTFDLNGNTSFKGIDNYSSTQIAGVALKYMAGLVRMAAQNTSGPLAPAKNIVKPGIEVPGAALFTIPIVGTDTQIISMVQADNCPTGDVTMNYAYVQLGASADLSAATRESVGTLSWSQSANTLTLADKRTVVGPAAVAGTTTYTGTCRNGIFTDNGNAITAVLSNANVAVVKILTGANAGDVLYGIPQTQITDQNSLASLYAGFTYDSNNPGNPVQILQGTFRTAAAELNYNSVNPNDYTATDNVLVDHTLVIDQIDTGTKGFMHARNNRTGRDFLCVASTNTFFSSLKLILCTGVSPSSVTKGATYVFISRN